jgi:helix-turn-helix protein
MSEEESFGKFPLLETLLAAKGRSLKGTYTNRDVADMFDVAVRTIQEWSRNGNLRPRKLPGRAKFLSEDLEEFLQNSTCMPQQAADNSGPQSRYISRNKSFRRHVAG